MIWKLDDEAEPSQPSRLRRTSGNEGPKVTEAADLTWWERVPETAWMAEDTSYSTDEQAAVEIAVDLPNSEREWKQFYTGMPPPMWQG